MQIITHYKQHYLTLSISQNTVSRLLACININAIFKIIYCLCRSQSNSIVLDLIVRKFYTIVLLLALIIYMRYLIIFQSILNYRFDNIFVERKTKFVNYCVNKVAQK